MFGSRKALDRIFGGLEPRRQRLSAGEVEKAETDKAILPLDGSTSAAAAAFGAVKAKIDDYFTRCRLAAFDPRAIIALNREEKEYLVFAGKDLTLSSAEIAGFPLAQVAADKPLPLGEGVNPAWAERLAAFQTAVIKPLYDGKSGLSEADWNGIKSRFAAYEGWLATKTGALVEPLGLKRVREHGGSVNLVCTNPQIKKIFDITGLVKIFGIYEDEDAAMKALV